MDKKIIDFIKKHHVLTLATSNNNKSYCANCFYAFLEDENSFIFTSDKDTKHIQDALLQNFVSGSVVLETSIIGKIQGIQFTGILFSPEGDLKKKITKTYMRKYPFAKLMKTTLWVLKLNFVKMTDNRFGFGKKLIWKSK
ncbi:MAG: hypothetical protein B6I24_10285 [Bacteroidetes bacterium 4572_128]|nr:MAG: hypothetical protein B6I24_10285 [Bacteroidetes bacterium 4572_128]